MKKLLIVLLTLALNSYGFESDSKGYDKIVRPFMEKHCFTCHGAKKQKGKLRVDNLSSNLIETEATQKWIEIMDSLSLGEMPPEDEERPNIKEQEKVMNWISTELKKARRHLQSSGGRVLMRRLNRSEYTKTIEDLFHLNFVEGEGPMAVLSPDGKIDGFTKMSKALMLDPSLMQNYYSLAKEVADKALQTEPPKIRSEKRRMETEEIGTFGGISYIAKRRSSEVTKDGMKLYAEGLRTFGQLKHSFNKQMIPKLGRYTIRFRAGADKGERGEALYLVMKTGGLGEIKKWEIDAPADKPKVYGITLDIAPQGNGEIGLNFVNGSGFQTVERVLGSYEKKIKELIKAGKKKEAEKLRGRSILEGRSDGLPFRLNPKTYSLKGLPYIFVDYIEIEGPLTGPWPSKSMVEFFPNGYEKSAKDESEAKRVLTKLIPKAFRRPMKAGELDVYMGLFKKQRAQGNDFIEALKVCFTAVLCSPDFLYIFEPNQSNKKRKLDDFELASRLSYFLWSSMPDNELFNKASQGKLKDKAFLAKEVDRLLGDYKSDRFYEGFVSEWLMIHEFDNFEPDKYIYKEFHSNENTGISEDMKQEPMSFVKEIVNSNGSMLECIKSDWTMLNAKLAKYYGIKGVEGSHFRRVKMPANSNRGGLITMAGFHMWGSDGNRTKPVERGKYVLDVLFNDPPPPPPPNAGEIEPNIKGKNLTVRERLIQHQEIQSCAVCHRKIDPYGLGLENFNVIGKWRDQQDGEKFRNKGPKVIVDGKLPNGESFKNFNEYRDVLAGMKDRFAKGLTEKLLTYALGRTIEPSDLGEIEDIVAKVRKENYSMRSLLKAIVQSEAFHSK